MSVRGFFWGEARDQMFSWNTASFISALGEQTSLSVNDSDALQVCGGLMKLSFFVPETLKYTIFKDVKEKHPNLVIRQWWKNIYSLRYTSEILVLYLSVLEYLCFILLLWLFLYWVLAWVYPQISNRSLKHHISIFKECVISCCNHNCRTTIYKTLPLTSPSKTTEQINILYRHMYPTCTSKTHVLHIYLSAESVWSFSTHTHLHLWKCSVISGLLNAHYIHNLCTPTTS